MKSLLLILFITISIFSIKSQQEILPIDNNFNQNYNVNQIKNFHTAIRPYNISKLKKNNVEADTNITQNPIDKLKQNFRKNKTKYFISPIGENSIGVNTYNKNINYTTSLGLIFQYNISKKITAEITYKYFVSKQPKYIDTSLFSKNILPSIGRLGLINSQYRGVNDLQGYLSYSPNKFFSFLLGKGNNFWGDGYRSFLLSDNASPYPFFRIESNFWKVKYTNLYSWHSDISNWNSVNKFSASHHLSWNVIEGLNIGLFETVIWAGKDTLINRGFDVNYINPVVFYRPIEYAQGSNDNSIMGLNIKGVVKKQHILYGQLLLDEFLLAEIRSDKKWWGNKYSIQIGYKNHNLFNNKKTFFLLEYNISRPFTYSHTVSTLNYGHLNQSLAHPLGANFKEVVQKISYKHKRWVFNQQFNFIQYGADTSNVNMGGNIYASYKTRNGDYGHNILQGKKHKIIYTKLQADYRLIDAINLKAFSSIIIRNEITKNNVNLFVNVGIKTNLWNSYTDY